jgi:hypothetical protein
LLAHALRIEHFDMIAQADVNCAVFAATTQRAGEASAISSPGWPVLLIAVT